MDNTVNNKEYLDILLNYENIMLQMQYGLISNNNAQNQLQSLANRCTILKGSCTNICDKNITERLYNNINTAICNLTCNYLEM